MTAAAINNLDPVLASEAGRADRITYRSTSLAGESIEVSASLLTPKGQAPEGGWPVVSWAHTTLYRTLVARTESAPEHVEVRGSTSPATSTSTTTSPGTVKDDDEHAAKRRL